MLATRSASSVEKRIACVGGALAVAGLTWASPALGQSNLTGGAMVRPVIQKVACVRACSSRGGARIGSAVGLRGSGLAAVRKVVFTGGPGKRDDVGVRARPRSDRLLKVRVPASAAAGPLIAVVAPKLASKPSKAVRILPPPPPPPLKSPPAALTPVPGPRDPGGPRLETALSTAKLFYGAQGGVSLSYRVSDDGPVSVAIELVRAADGAVASSWAPPPAPPGTVQTVTWNGMAAGTLQPEGRYSFRVSAEGQRGARALSAQAPDAQRDAFDFYQHIFPVRLKHDYGDAGARFGSGRGGRGHQGQDVFARCGARLVAARGGRVKFAGFHRAAGNYIVISGDDGLDYVYMHLAAPSPFRTGQRVYTGQQIGAVGDTGNADGCHLHFEMWDAPGWYDGGKPFDPLPPLQAWDSFS